MIRKRRLPIVGDGGGVWSFVHVDDAAAATVAAIDGGSPGAYNVADDEPAAGCGLAARAGRVLGASRRDTCRSGSAGWRAATWVCR